MGVLSYELIYGVAPQKSGIRFLINQSDCSNGMVCFYLSRQLVYFVYNELGTC